MSIIMSCPKCNGVGAINHHMDYSTKEDQAIGKCDNTECSTQFFIQYERHYDKKKIVEVDDGNIWLTK